MISQRLPMIRFVFVMLLLTLTAEALYAQPAAESRPAPRRVQFTRDIRPILSDYCFKCHGPDAKTRKAELRLDTKQGAFAGRDGAKMIVPGNSQRSELIRRIQSADSDERMPPASEKLQLTKRQIELLKRWIDEGAKWEEHWAFIPPVKPRVPEVAPRDRDHVRNAIDAFVVARLRKAGLQPSPAARRTTLLRRVTLDLTGLPPTLAEINAFVNDRTPDAYEKVVDRLLNSPAYGERMAWNWLDAARYADTNGFQGDPERTMWPWRDWLVSALNSNKPFDQFTIDMLAGDQLPNATLDQIVATGFNRNHMINGEGGRIPEETRVENVFDRTETTATVWMGLTMTCCRCHDHKFDPISQREYYSFYAFFNNTSEDGRGRSGAAAPVVRYVPPESRNLIASLEMQLREQARNVADFEKKHASALSSATPSAKAGNKAQWNRVKALFKKKPAQRNAKELQSLEQFFKKSHPAYAGLLRALRTARGRRDAASKAVARVMVMDELPKRRETFILTRGTYNKPTEKVTRGTPGFLPPLPADPRKSRLSLAKWLVGGSHPLTARVTVNRYWQQFFGTGLVRTTEDFGIQGERPSHPLLLDWLATEFVRSGWNVKQMHRLIVTSATYRQSSKRSQADFSAAAKTASDPGNRLLSRFPRYRMPSWMLRDQALAISGLQVTRLGGSPVKPYQPPGVWAEATFGKKRYVQDHGDKLYRRSLYIFWRRIVGPTMFFDSAARQTCEVKPSRTNTPLHALTTLNDTTYVEAARAFAQRVMQATPSDAKRIRLAFQLATARRPSRAEFSILSSRLVLLKRQFEEAPAKAAELLKTGESPRDASLPAIDHAAWSSLCLLLLNLDEFFGRSAVGIGTAALASLLQADLGAAGAPSNKGLPGIPHFAPKAKRVIYLFQNGAPAHVELFDYKPKLAEWHGKQIPDSIQKGKRLSTMTAGQKDRPVLSNISKFRRYGESGATICDFLPNTAAIADKLCFVKSLHTSQVNHAPAITYFMSGDERPGRPSMGAWLTYGLGSETEELPGFVVMTSRDKEASCGQIFYDYYWGNGFLPSKFQGVKFRGAGDPVLYLSNPKGMSRTVRRGILDDLAKLNELKLKEFGDPEIATRISQYEMAYRMQTSVPDLIDLKKEPKHILDSYGPDVHRQGSFAYNCLMARKLAEKGVRFIQLMHAGWDQHRNLNRQLEIQRPFCICSASITSG
eukprot:g8399.t1